MITFKPTYQLYINGTFRDASDGRTIPVYNPSNGEKLSEIAAATKADVDDAVKGAWEAFASWKKTTTKQRAAILRKIADVIDQNAEELAMIETLDNGKPIRETRNIEYSGHPRASVPDLQGHLSGVSRPGKNYQSIPAPKSCVPEL